jgi:hypothetical protein
MWIRVGERALRVSPRRYQSKQKQVQAEAFAPKGIMTGYGDDERAEVPTDLHCAAGFREAPTDFPWLM